MPGIYNFKAIGGLDVLVLPIMFTVIGLIRVKDNGLRSKNVGLVRRISWPTKDILIMPQSYENSDGVLVGFLRHRRTDRVWRGDKSSLNWITINTIVLITSSNRPTIESSIGIQERCIYFEHVYEIKCDGKVINWIIYKASNGINEIGFPTLLRI